MLAQIAARLDKVEVDFDDDPDDDYLSEQDLGELRRAVDAFAEADRQALAHDGRSRWADAVRPPIIGGLGPALPHDAGDPRGGHTISQGRFQSYRSRAPQVREWIAEALADLAAGKPAYALVLGRELHWLDADDYRADSLRLLAGAYRALGRDALAEIAEVHHAHRDLSSVAVLTT